MPQISIGNKGLIFVPYDKVENPFTINTSHFDTHVDINSVSTAILFDFVGGATQHREDPCGRRGGGDCRTTDMLVPQQGIYTCRVLCQQRVFRPRV
jgi:hypothetical protein